mgnify:CR=1 FL=1
MVKQLPFAGRLVAVPTETVYGLAADATNPEAVRGIFAAKQRPANHPLIVHLAGAAQLSRWAKDIPDAAWRLAEAFWPGPLTLLYPQWIPGNHSPTGAIDKLAGLTVTANGKVIPWTRDQYDVYAFHVDVPQGAGEVVAEFSNYLRDELDLVR